MGSVIVVYRLGSYGNQRISRTADKRRTRMGAGTLRRNVDPDNCGPHVYDHHATADTITMTPNVKTRDTTY